MRTTAPVSITYKGYVYVRLPNSKVGGGNGLIEVNQDVQFGEPVIRGTRIPASTIAEMHSCGDSVKTLCSSYNITVDQVQACVDYINVPVQRTTADTCAPAGGQG